MLSGLSLCVSIFGFYLLASTPDNGNVMNALAEAQIEFGRVTSEVASCKREFRQLEQDVDDAMEKASTRMQKAKTAESNMRRKERNGYPGQPPADPIAAEFALRQAALRDGTGGFR